MTDRPFSRILNPRRRDLLKAGLASPIWAMSVAGDATADSLGAFQTEVVDLDLADRIRSRIVKTRCYIPVGAGRRPVIIFSHGFGGSSEAFPNTCRAWASQGHVVLVPTHSDSITAQDADSGQRRRMILQSVIAARRSAAEGRQRQFRRSNAEAVDRGASLADMLEDPKYLSSRLEDVAFLKAALTDPRLGLDARVLAVADPSRMGMAGHSFGAYTTLVIGGAELSPPPQAPVPKGFLGHLAISGQGPGRMALTESSFRSMTGPLFAATGTEDFGAAEETPPWRLTAFHKSPPGHKYAAVLKGFRHMDFDPSPTDPEHGAQGEAFRALQMSFWRATLRGDSSGFARLNQVARGSRVTDPVWFRSR